MQHPFNIHSPCRQEDIDLFNTEVLKAKNQVLFGIGVFTFIFFIVTIYMPVFSILFVGTVISMSIVHTYYINKTAYELDHSFYMELHEICSSDQTATMYMHQLKATGRYFTNYEYHMLRSHVDADYKFDRSMLVD